MNFLNPTVLLALIAASIPVLLHIFNLRKLKTVEFSTLRFIHELKKTQIKKLKLKQIILLILRVLIIVCLVLAFSRPVIQGNFPLFQSYAKSSAVILLDNSISMDFSDEHGRRFTQAKNAAMAVVDQLSDGSEIALVPMSEATVNKSNLFTKDYKKLKEDINNIKLQYIPANVDNSLKIAEYFLNDAKNINKEIFIFSDFQENTFDRIAGDTLRLENPNTAIYLLPIGMLSNTDIKNLSIDSLKVLSSIFRKDRAVDVEASIRNYSMNDNDGIVVSLSFNNVRIAQRNIDIPAGETRTVSISGVPQTEGVISAKVDIEGDALEADNKRYFGFILPETNNTLVVGNTNRFFKAFFDGIQVVNSFTNQTFIEATELAATDLTDYDVLLLAEDVYTQNDLSRIEQYVDMGGKALIFANDTTEKALFANFIDSLGFGNITKRKYSGIDPIIFNNIDKQHPIFESVFDGSTDSKKEIETPNLKKVQIVSDGYYVMTLDNEGFLAESKKGEGKSIFIGASIDSRWGNFALTGLFPTLLYRSLVYLNASEMISECFEVGQDKIVQLPELLRNNTSCQVIDPYGNPIFLNVLQSPTAPFIMTKTQEILGNYTIYSDKEKPVAMFSQNLSSSESYISTFTETQLEEKIEKRLNKENMITLIKNTNKINDNIIKARIGTELWKIFALLAIIFAVTEMLVSRIGTNNEE